ncbi:MAG: CRISPR-associated helicase Cas3' [Candidatus Thiodiazotropha sp. (ex Dulcina madagascariensis)]|nr:CRISPR-associated helicase Cas3' [Candidatus Thiodiazotropha sp. (ex Dulcina madagascariensis)]MCU7928138.1 CRISPR-associated helicase Cas3' [Candidatus Thiodiazotropha sp. (ex Dulcina madagascariensis)]
MVGQRNTLKIIWGKFKSDPGGERPLYLPLTHHCLDVAVVFRRLANLPGFRRSLTAAAKVTLTPAQFERLAVLALLHDFGKANLGFQDKPFDPKAPRAGHVYETAPLFREPQLFNRLSECLALDQMGSWFEGEASLQSYLAAILSHHGRPIPYQALERNAHKSYFPAKKHWWRNDGQRDPFEAVAELMTTARQAFPAAFDEDAPPIPGSTQLQHRFAGLLMLADWLGSHDIFFPIDNGKADRPKLAHAAAVRILKTVGLDVQAKQQALEKRSWRFEPLFGFPPYPLQQTLDQLPTDDPAHRLLIAEAETGSGKTEAALIRFFRLFAAGEADGLYFALPTRVAARELYQRVLGRVEKAFPDPATRPMVLLAVPGYAKIDGLEAKLLPERAVSCNDEADQQRRERAWAAEHPKRFLAATIAVGTIDQALLSALQTPHAHLRSVCLDRQLLVVDEVHASDPYMRHLLTELLRHHLRAGHTLLLSATLGTVAQEAFLHAAGTKQTEHTLEESVKAPYPALTNGAGERQPLLKAGTRSKRVTVACAPHLTEPEALLPRIQQALDQGARILVVLNTVDRVLGLQRTVEEALPADLLFRCQDIITPHHGRYSPSDRELLDAAVSRRLGKSSAPGPLLLIGTQTLEQSLDIDADLLITDLCPMDVLLQRIGRLHRHERERPAGMKAARCLLLTPEEGSLEDWLQTNGEAIGNAKRMGLGSVYADLRTLQLTWDWLLRHPRIKIPRDNRLLVESVTHPDALAQLKGPRWQKHAQKQFGALIAQEDKADRVSLIGCYDRSFGTFAFPKKMEEKVSTRLGLNALRLPLPAPIDSPFSIHITEMIIPGHMAPERLKEEEITDLKPTEGGFKFRLGPKCYRYSRHGLEILDESTN